MCWMKHAFVISCILIAGAIMPTPAGAERIKDIAVFEGVRENQLIGYGLVTGLDGKCRGN